MKLLLRLIALLLIFFVLAFLLGFAEIEHTEGDVALPLGVLSLYIPREALLALQRSVDSLGDALPAHSASDAVLSV